MVIYATHNMNPILMAQSTEIAHRSFTSRAGCTKGYADSVLLFLWLHLQEDDVLFIFLTMQPLVALQNHCFGEEP